MSIFSKVKGLRVKKNAFNLSHDIMQTMEIGQITPCYIHDGVLPNSKEQLSFVNLTRFQALLAPMQHKVDMYLHFWYVPYRITDPNFSSFISGQTERDGGTYHCPQFTYREIFALLTQLVVNDGDNSSPRDIYNRFFNGSSLLVFLGYPDLSSVEWGSILEPPPADEHFLGRYREAINMRRIQAYTFIIAQYYTNENVPMICNSPNGTDFDLIPALYAYGKGNFKECYNLFHSAGFPNRFTFDLTYYDGTHNSDVYSLVCMLYSLQQLNASLCFPHAWSKDYFTSALPFTQLGEEVSIPLGQTISFNGFDKANAKISSVQYGSPRDVNKYNMYTAPGDVTSDERLTSVTNASGGSVEASQSLSEISGQISIDGDLDAEIGAVTINELRTANALQRLKESYARFGTRYQEWLKGFWNQSASDRSLQQPEWLGGGKVNINISEIEQTSATSDESLSGAFTPLGTLAGKGTGLAGRYVYSRHFEDPGLVIGLCFLQPKQVYSSQGLDKMLTKTDNIYDYFTPQMEHLGEQEVSTLELNYLKKNTQPSNFLLGYQSRYAEYKFIPSRYRGQFSNILNFWHLGRRFENNPELNDQLLYIQHDQVTRPFAIQQIDNVDVSHVLTWLHFDVKYIAPMSRFGTPSLLN